MLFSSADLPVHLVTSDSGDVSRTILPALLEMCFTPEASYIQRRFAALHGRLCCVDILYVLYRLRQVLYCYIFYQLDTHLYCIAGVNQDCCNLNSTIQHYITILVMELNVTWYDPWRPKWACVRWDRGRNRE